MRLNHQPVNGRFGKYGGKYIPETLVPAIEELESAYEKNKNDPEFQKELSYYLANYAGRPTPLYFARNLSEYLGGARIYLKREDLLHGGAHKTNNTLGQALLAKRMGTKDVRRQSPNVVRMQLLGTKVHEVFSGSQTLKDAINEALRDWITNVRNTYYLIGSVVGPHPYPMMVRDFQSIIGYEIKKQMKNISGQPPSTIVACVGGGSNAIGTFYSFLDDDQVQLFGVEAGGEGINSGKHSATLIAGSEGILHGMLTYLLQDEFGQVTETHSISAGLDYPGVGPEHALLKDIKRVRYVQCIDKDAVDAFLTLSKVEGIIPALEPAHAVSYAMKLAKKMDRNDAIVVTLSGRGDKDVEIDLNHQRRRSRE